MDKTKPKDKEADDGEALGRSSSEETKSKVVKLSPNKDLDLVLNLKYTTKEFIHAVNTNWHAKAAQDFRDNDTGVEIYGEPFQICLLPALLQYKQSCEQLVHEMVNKVCWSRKQMDLYEFYQSPDLSNMPDCQLLASFLQMLRGTVRPWLQRVTGLKLDYVSASCSMYTCGDYLLVHDDLLKDRQIAYIYYLTPWEGAEQWKAEQGGCLEIFDSDDSCFPNFPVRRKISPRNNQFAFFKVGSRSFHQVGEVTQFDYPRLTINGWFHGASNDELIADVLRPFAKLDFKPPSVEKTDVDALQMLNEVYLREGTRQSIQKRIEDNSEICLYEFLRRELFEQALEQLRSDNNLKWQRQGPASAQNYEILQLDSASASLAQLLALFSSAEMFTLLRDYTDLDLAGENAATPSYSLELQRWSHGNYTVLGEGALCEENTLDLTFYLNAAEGAAIITYLSPEAEEEEPQMPRSLNDDDEDDSVLLTITPVDNALNIVYRCEGTTKFTKYVSHNTPLPHGPVYVISCSYKE